MKYGSLLLAFGLLFSTAGAGAQEAANNDADTKTPAKAAEAPKPITYKDWQVVCLKDKNGKELCQMGQHIGSLTVGKNKEGEDVVFPILMKLIFNPGENTPIISVSLPIGVPLPPGVGLQIDGGKALRMPFQMCLRNECVAAMEAKTSLVSALKKGNQATLSIILQDKPGQAPVSLQGFTKAFNHIKPK